MGVTIFFRMSTHGGNRRSIVFFFFRFCFNRIVCFLNALIDAVRYCLLRKKKKRNRSINPMYVKKLITLKIFIMRLIYAYFTYLF